MGAFFDRYSHEFAITVIFITKIDFIFIFSRYLSSTNGTLKLLSVQEGDEGAYQCIVANQEDTAQGTAYLWLGGSA